MPPVRNDEAVAAILDALRFVEAEPRRRSAHEAPWEHTLRLLRLEAAWALRRVGAPEQADQLATQPLQELAGGRPVERRLAALYGDRLHTADRLPPDAEGPQRSSQRLQTLERFDQYQVYRFVENSQVLSPNAFLVSPLQTRSREATVDGRLVPRFDSLAQVRSALAALPAHPAEALKAVVGCLRAAARFGLPAVQSGLELVKARWPGVTDAYSSNDYACLSALQFFDGIVFALAEAANPTPPELPPEFEPSLLANGDLEAPALVLGDWLETRGPSPWGELIAVQHALGSAPTEPALLEREAQLLAMLQPFKPPPPARGETLHSRCEWRAGFIRAATLVDDSTGAASRQLRALLASPRGRFLRELTLVASERYPTHASALRALATQGPQVLESLSFRAPRPSAPRPGRRPRPPPAGPIDLRALWPALPALRQLTAGGPLRLGEVPPGQLQQLTAELRWPPRFRGTLETSRLPGLLALTVTLPDVTQLRPLETWLSARSLPDLRELNLCVRHAHLNLARFGFPFRHQLRSFQVLPGGAPS